MTPRVVLIAGTGSWKPGVQDWFIPGSPFTAFLRAHGVEVVAGTNGRPFTWSTGVGGIGFGDEDHRVWQGAGENLYDYIVPPFCPDRRIPIAETNIIAHSHGLQVALYACAAGLGVDTLISVGSPIRKDMDTTARLARRYIRRWIHVHSDRSDRWQWYGTLFDGAFGIKREHPLADVNVGIPKVGHSTILRDPAMFTHWQERGLLAALQEVPAVEGV